MITLKIPKTIDRNCFDHDFHSQLSTFSDVQTTLVKIIRHDQLKCRTGTKQGSFSQVDTIRRNFVTCSDVTPVRVKYDAAVGPRGPLFTSPRNIGGAAEKQRKWGWGGRLSCETGSWLELRCSAF